MLENDLVSDLRRHRPNLVFIFADQMRGMDMGCAGNPDVHTPAMDLMAEQGIRLSHCYATTPVCGPNRAILQTGVYPTTHRVVGNDLALPVGIPTFGTLALENGYRTGYIGKWHLDGQPRTRFTPPGARRHGYEFWAAYNCSHDYFHPRFYRDTPDVVETAGYEPVVQTDRALQFLSDYASEPFCLLLSWGPPHDPYDQVPDSYQVDNLLDRSGRSEELHRLQEMLSGWLTRTRDPFLPRSLFLAQQELTDVWAERERTIRLPS